MIQGVTHNGLLAAVFGTGHVARSAPPTIGPRDASGPSRGNAANELHPQPVDVLDLSARKPVTAADVRHDPQHETRIGGARGFEAHASLQRESGPGGSVVLSPEEEQDVRNLRERDQEVRRHEQAHAAAGGPHARGGPTFEYETGPDGKQYAVGGEVQIDTSPVKGDPRATIAKMQQVRRAASAPANPSSQDRAVAAKAAVAEQEARAELARQRSETPADVEGRTSDSIATRGTAEGGQLYPRSEAAGTLLDLIV